MLEILTGIISGTISGTGMGGGTILILVLTMFMGIEQHIAQGANLIFFIPTSIAAIIAIFKDKLINWKTGITIGIAGIFGAAIGASIAVRMGADHLRKYFGFFLIAITIFEIYYVVNKYILNKRKT